MDLTVEDLRSELEKRGLDCEGNQEDLQARLEQARENEKDNKTETSQMDSAEKNPEPEQKTDKKEKDPVKKEEMAATKEGEGDVVENETEVTKKVDETKVTKKVDETKVTKKVETEVNKKVDETEVNKKVDETEVNKKVDKPEEEKSLSTSSAEETSKEKKEDSTSANVDNTSSQQKTTDDDDDAAAGDNTTTDDDAAAGDNTTTAETKDSTANPPATKGEENESLIVLVDDTQNDLDADLLAKEKASNKNEGKKSDDANAANSTCNAPEAESKNKDGAGGGDKGDTKKGKTDGKTEKKADEKKDDKDGKLKSSSAVPRVKSSKNASSGNANSCNLWISGLSTNTKASHLKTIFTKYGKVIGAKVVTNAHSAGARCYGFLTMSSPEEATKCIQHLNKRELHGRMISVERAKTIPGLQPLKKIKPGTKLPEKTDVKKSEEKSPNKKSSTTEKKSEGNLTTKKPPEKKSVTGKSTPKKSDKPEVKKDGKPQTHPEKGDSHSKKPRLSSDKSKPRTPSKRSSHSHSPRRHHSSMEPSSGRVKRDYKLTLELKQRKNYLKRAVRRQKRWIDHARLVELELQTRQKEEAHRLERVREELRMEREKLDRKRMRLERAEQNQMWKERQEADMFNGIERERHAVKRPYERKPSHNYGFWDEPKRPNVSGSSTSRFSRSSFSEETWFGNHKETYDRRSDSYYNRDNKPMEQVGRFSDSNHGRINAHSPQRAGLERYGPPESSSRLADHVSSDNRFERRDISSGGYHGHDTDHRNLAADRSREIDRRNVSAHERLGRIRNQAVGGSSWKVDNWSHSHGGMDTSHHQWVNSNNNNMNQNYDRENGSGVGGGNSGFPSGSSSSGGGLAQNMGMGNMFSTVAQQPSMMAGGSGGNMGSRMQEPRFDAYKNMEHGGMRRY